MFRNFIHWFSTPQNSSSINPKNFVRVQIDAIGVALANSAAPFLPVFLTRLGGSSFEISLLTTMPSVAGFLLSITLGRILQSQKKIVPWFSGTRLAVISMYALTGLVSFLVPQVHLVKAILLVWALATIPQTLLNICFPVVMNNVAGPTGRFELMSRRWSIMGLTTSIAVLAIGQFLDRMPPPYNYPAVFMAISLGGLISYYFSSKLEMTDVLIVEQKERTNFLYGVVHGVQKYVSMIRSEPAFLSFVSKRFIFQCGTALAAPLFPLYFVRVVGAPDSWIAAINTAQTAVLVIGYFVWLHQSRRKGSQGVLLWSTLGASLYPILVAQTNQVWLIAILAGINGIFQAGLNLVFFDELLKTFPAEYSATFVGFAQSMQYLASIISPLVGSYLADHIGIGVSLVISGGLTIIGFLLFAVNIKSIKVVFSRL